MRVVHPTLIAILLTAVLATGCGNQGDSLESKREKAEQIAATLASSDALFLERSEIDKLRQAVKALEDVRDPDDRNFDVESRYSKYCYYLGRLTDDPTEQDRMWEVGHRVGRIASNVRPDRPDGFYWAGANLGEQSIKNPVTVGIKSVDEIRDYMKRTIEIDPSFEGGAAYDALAQVELMTGLIGGKPETAAGLLEKAMGFGNKDPRTRLHLAEAYLAIGRTEDSKRQLRLIVDGVPEHGYEAEHKQVLEKAKQMLMKRF